MLTVFNRIIVILNCKNVAQDLEFVLDMLFTRINAYS